MNVEFRASSITTDLQPAVEELKDEKPRVEVYEEDLGSRRLGIRSRSCDLP